MRRLLPKLTALFFPPQCIGCHVWAAGEAEEICPICLDGLNFLAAPAHLPKLKRRFFNAAYSLFSYEGKVVEWISRFKYSRQLYIGRVLGERMAGMKIPWKSYDAVVPVPLHWWRQVRRGFNPALILAYEVAMERGLPLFAYLRRRRATKQQTRQTAEARLTNVRGAFDPAATFQNGRILLIDDVLTTGSTVNEAARALKKAGALTVDVLTLARTLR